MPAFVPTDPFIFKMVDLGEQKRWAQWEEGSLGRDKFHAKEIQFELNPSVLIATFSSFRVFFKKSEPRIEDPVPIPINQSEAEIGAGPVAIMKMKRKTRASLN